MPVPASCIPSRFALVPLFALLPALLNADTFKLTALCRAPAAVRRGFQVDANTWYVGCCVDCAYGTRLFCRCRAFVAFVMPPISQPADYRMGAVSTAPITPVIVTFHERRATQFPGPCCGYAICATRLPILPCVVISTAYPNGSPVRPTHGRFLRSPYFPTALPGC